MRFIRITAVMFSFIYFSEFFDSLRQKICKRFLTFVYFASAGREDCKK